MRRLAPRKKLWSAKQIERIVCDPEFAGMSPNPSAAEKEYVTAAAFRQSAREPLVVWNRAGRMILLLGYDVFPTVRLYRLSFEVVAKQFGTREEARLFIVRDLLLRKSLPPLWASYLRGLRYEDEPRERGGDHKSPKWKQTGRKTARALAEMLGVSVQKLRDDAKLSFAVRQIADASPPGQRQEVIAALLSGKPRVTRAVIRRLGDGSERERKDAGFLLITTGKLASDKQRPKPTKPKVETITLPLVPHAFAEALEEDVGREECLAYYEAIGRRLTNDHNPDLKLRIVSAE